MDIVVDGDTAREFGVGNEEARGVELVAGLAAEDGWVANRARCCAAMGVTVGDIGTVGEVAEDFEVGLLEGGANDGSGLWCISR